MLKRLKRIEDCLQDISDGLSALHAKCVQAEADNKKLREMLEKLYEHGYKIRGSGGKDGTTHTGDL